MDMFRSEEMQLVRLIIPSEAAHDTIYSLGEVRERSANWCECAFSFFLLFLENHLRERRKGGGTDVRSIICSYGRAHVSKIMLLNMCTCVCRS